MMFQTIGLNTGKRQARHGNLRLGLGVGGCRAGAGQRDCGSGRRETASG